MVVVDVPIETQLARTMSRDDNDEAQVKRIIAAQMPRQQRLDKADYVIDNSRTLNELDEAVRALHEEFIAMAASR